MSNLKIIKRWAVALAFVVTIGGSAFVTLVPQTVAAVENPTCSKRFLGFPVWYRGLTVSGTDCTIASPDSLNTAGTGEHSNGLSNFIWRIALNVIEIGMMLVGYISVILVIFGGFKYLTSQGSPDAAAKAKTTITNAVIGLAISIVAVAAVNFIVGGLAI